MENPDSVPNPSTPILRRRFQFRLLTLLELIFGLALILSAWFWKVDPQSHVSEVFAGIAVVLIAYGVFRRRWVLVASALVLGIVLYRVHYHATERLNYRSETDLVTHDYTLLVRDRQSKRPIPHAHVTLRSGDEESIHITAGETNDKGMVQIGVTFRGTDRVMCDGEWPAFNFDDVSFQVSTIEIHAAGFEPFKSNLSNWKKEFETFGTPSPSSPSGMKEEIIFELIPK